MSVTLYEIDITNLKPWDALKKVMEYVNENKEYNKLSVNGQLGSFLMDAFESQNLEVIKQPTGMRKEPIPYKIIKLKHTEIFVDPNMLWDDTRLIFESDSDTKIVKVNHSNNLI